MSSRRVLLPVVLSIGLLFISGCGLIRSVAPSPTSVAPASAEGVAESNTLDLTSPAFSPGETIPEKYACDGQDVSPPLSWSAPPQGTETFAIIVDDPDAPAGTWVHWVLFNIPADTRSLPENVPAEEELPDGALHGRNSWRRTGYGGPCPPSGSSHRYTFTLFAVDIQLDLSAGATKQQVLRAMDGRVLARGQLMGTYSR